MVKGGRQILKYTQICVQKTYRAAVSIASHFCQGLPSICAAVLGRDPVVGQA